MDRRDWISAFLDELLRLRPHLATASGFPIKAAHTIAALEYHPDVEPKVAAQRYHARQPAAKAGRR